MRIYSENEKNYTDIALFLVFSHSIYEFGESAAGFTFPVYPGEIEMGLMAVIFAMTT